MSQGNIPTKGQVIGEFVLAGLVLIIKIFLIASCAGKWQYLVGQRGQTRADPPLFA